MISTRSHRRDRDLAETSPIFSRARAQTARAVFALRAERPWALTGTPVQNDPAELYSLLHFLRVPVASSYGKWTKELARPDRLRALQGLIRPLMLRRTKGTKDADGARDCAEIAPVRPRGRRRLTSKPRVTVWQMSHATRTCVDPSAMDVGHPSMHMHLSGESILSLPQLRMRTLKIPFSKPEADFYEALHSRSRTQFET